MISIIFATFCASALFWNSASSTCRTRGLIRNPMGTLVVGRLLWTSISCSRCAASSESKTFFPSSKVSPARLAEFTIILLMPLAEISSPVGRLPSDVAVNNPSWVNDTPPSTILRSAIRVASSACAMCSVGIISPVASRNCPAYPVKILSITEDAESTMPVRVSLVSLNFLSLLRKVGSTASPMMLACVVAAMAPGVMFAGVDGPCMAVPARTSCSNRPDCITVSVETNASTSAFHFVVVSLIPSNFNTALAKSRKALLFL